jgi:hypothetical protein
MAALCRLHALHPILQVRGQTVSGDVRNFFIVRCNKIIQNVTKGLEDHAEV